MMQVLLLFIPLCVCVRVCVLASVRACACVQYVLSMDLWLPNAFWLSKISHTRHSVCGHKNVFDFILYYCSFCNDLAFVCVTLHV